MAKKNSDFFSFAFISVFAVIILIVGAFLLGGNLRAASNVLGATTSSTSTPTKAGAVASAAYTKCIENGGFVTTAKRGNSGYYNVCNFADDMSCELYSLYNGQCPVGGVHSIGYDTTAQVFCALRGGKPQGSENGQCKMPDGKICSTASVYNGTCSPN
ncbi:MAG TPA: DUF333 domain-containing protein [Candidatus Levybacteria bacterium]|nr:DUF333 domain-containing protein [Candidatus Levybacteria bacterium]